MKDTSRKPIIWLKGEVNKKILNELSPEENAFIELKLALSRQLKELRKAQNFSQETVAKKIQSSQCFLKVN